MPLVNPIPNVISSATPIKVGGTPDAGAGLLASAFDHVHGLVETAGPTNLGLGAILDGELVRRAGANLTGRTLRMASSSGGTDSNGGTTPANVSPNLTFALEAGGRSYIVMWFVFYITNNSTTGIMLGVNFTGTASGERHGLLIATGGTTMYAAYGGGNDTMLGNATVGPGSTGRVGMLWCRLRGVSVAGSLALRYASGVASSSVSVVNDSFGIVLQD